MDRTCVQNGPKRYPKDGHEMDTTWDKKTRPTKRDMEKICGEGDETTGMVLGPSATLGNRQAALAFVGEDLMCYQARRGPTNHLKYGPCIKIMQDL